MQESLRNWRRKKSTLAPNRTEGTNLVDEANRITIVVLAIASTCPFAPIARRVAQVVEEKRERAINRPPIVGQLNN